MKRRSLLAISAAALGTVAVTGIPAQATDTTAGRSASMTETEALVSYVMAREGMTQDRATDYLATKADKQRRLDGLKVKGVRTDGAYFTGDQLTVVVDDATSADAVRAAGLRASTARGQKDLDALGTSVLAKAGANKKAIRSVGAELESGTVKVRIAADAPAALRAQLKATPGVTVETAPEMTTHAKVWPGRIMDVVPGTWCSLGFNGWKNGNNVLLSAGHCVEGYPDVINESGIHIGRGVAGRFHTGYSSVDMGLMDVDYEDTASAYVDSRAGELYPIKGMSKNAIGSELCKAGNTTGWTCGTIRGYNRAVNYGNTYVTGLAESTVCTEGGDSGGAYIGVGDLAQGMTSGGPTNSDCGPFNSRYSYQNLSFYQPVVDAANYYGVTLKTIYN